MDLVTGRVRRIVDGCKFQFPADIAAGRVQSFLHELRQDTDKKVGISAQTFNFYLTAAKSFCRWLVKDRRANENLLAHLDGLNVKTDRRRDRRALTADELLQFLDATRNGPEREGLDGAERAMLYRLALETGLRQNELRSLTRASFLLDGTEPSVTVRAAYSKRRREDELPLRPELAAEMRGFLALLAPDAPAFRMPLKKPMGLAFKADVQAAGILYRDPDGRVFDFHGLRHQFISNLARGGVHPKTAQQLARHSTITLTMDRYSHTVREDLSDALNCLPDLAQRAAGTVKATGTDGAACPSHSIARPAPIGGSDGPRASERHKAAVLTEGRDMVGTGHTNEPQNEGSSVLASCLALSERPTGAQRDLLKRTQAGDMPDAVAVKTP